MGDDHVRRNMEHHAIVFQMLPWNQKEHDDLKPDGETVAEVIDHWLACRADIFEVGLGQTRWGISTQDVNHLAEHLEKWRSSRD
jgi:hypothetical protein